MSRSSYLFAGIFGSFAVSCFALVLVPQMQLGNLQAEFDEEANDIYPVSNDRKGRDIYIREGCMYCHSQQVRDTQNGTDQERGWGVRRTVARDFLYERVPQLGASRLGPDLANAGSPEWRNEAADDPRKPVRRDRAWHLLHLYEPTAVVTESNMPPYRYLFQKRRISGQKSAEALNVAVAEGYEIVPTAEARQLVDYLLSLDRSHVLAEALPPGAAAAPGAVTSSAGAPAAGAPVGGSAPAK